MEIFVERSFLDKNIQSISENLNFNISFKKPSNTSFLQYGLNGLSFVKDLNNSQQILHVDFSKGSLGWRIKRAQHEINIKKALGKSKDQMLIFDATAGLLSDTMIFLSLGHKVIALEQSKIIYSLVQDAIFRCTNYDELFKNLEFHNADSIDFYRQKKIKSDVIYLDPMYPDSKKNAKRSGAMEVIKSILEIENFSAEAENILDEFRLLNYQKIILKRPLKSKKNYSNINYQILGKATRFDIFL